MDASLLATKLLIPPQPRHAVPRSRLVDALEQGIQGHKLTLIAAPAGYGKTTLLTHWAHVTDMPCAWLSLDEGDNNQERFLRYLLTGWEKAAPQVGKSSIGLLLDAELPNAEAVLSAFINAAHDVSDHIAYIFDDYHLIDDPSLHQMLTFLLDHLPPTFHFVLSSRGEPPLPLARYRAHDEMQEFHGDDLAFSLEETADFFQRIAEIDLPPGKVAALQAQLEGWVTGLQLVALGFQQGLARPDELSISGRQRFIVDYLGEDVFAPLEKEIQRFLLQTCILERLCGSLCDTVTNRDDSQQKLEFLERANLFTTPLDDRREWFRYHSLFADFLRETLSRRYPGEVTDLHRRAANWYLARNQPEQAFHHAISAGDAELVSQILERFFIAKLIGGEVRTVQRWLDAIPETWQLDYPIIGLTRAGTLLVTGQFEACDRCLDEIERLSPADLEAAELQQARVSAMRCNVACFLNDLDQAKFLADQALRGLPKDDLDFRAGIYGALGDTYRRHGQWQEAQATYRELLNYTHAPTFRIEAVHVYGALADLALRQGHLREAEGYWRDALATIEEGENRGMYPLPLVGWVYIRLSELLYEWNDLVQARDYLSHGLEYADLGGDVRSRIAGYLVAGRLALTEGNLPAAMDYLEQARPLAESAQFLHWTGRFDRFQLEVWLAQDQLRAAVDWVEEALQDGSEPGEIDSATIHLAITRVLIVKGDRSSLDRALALLETLRQRAESEGRITICIEALAQLALTQNRLGDGAGALIALENALRLAESQSYVRRFVDFGLPMARLLQDAHARGVLSDYVTTLLDAFGEELPHPLSVQGPLPEALTDREQEILELISAGLTNPEIAEELVISPETVKKHASNIYSKLSVSSRTEAASRARDLGLLT